VEGAPELDKLRVYYNHPGFLEPQVDFILAALAQLPEDARAGAHVVFTTHSIPRTMSRHCDYETQHYEACRIVMELLAGRAPLPDGGERPWQLVFNSRSGPEFVPWLEPDINDHLEALAERSAPGAVCVPIGFISDHMEVIYDLDVEAVATAEHVGLPFARAATVGTDPRFVAMVRELVRERAEDAPRGRWAPGAPTTTRARSTAASPRDRRRRTSWPRRPHAGGPRADRPGQAITAARQVTLSRWRSRASGVPGTGPLPWFHGARRAGATTRRPG
jgi:protoporphyrin/coproporphyrin ferrochelatase